MLCASVDQHCTHLPSPPPSLPPLPFPLSLSPPYFSSDTRNELSESEGGYENISVAMEMAVPHLDLLHFIDRGISPSTASADCIPPHPQWAGPPVTCMSHDLDPFQSLMLGWWPWTCWPMPRRAGRRWGHSKCSSSLTPLPGTVTMDWDRSRKGTERQCDCFAHTFLYGLEKSKWVRGVVT